MKKNKSSFSCLSKNTASGEVKRFDILEFDPFVLINTKFKEHEASFWNLDIGGFLVLTQVNKLLRFVWQCLFLLGSWAERPGQVNHGLVVRVVAVTAAFGSSAFRAHVSSRGVSRVARLPWRSEPCV